MKTLFKLVGKNRMWVLISFTVAVLSIGVQFFWTINIGKLADSIVERNGITWTFILNMALLLLVNGLFQYLNPLTTRFCSEKMAHTLRMNFADAVLPGGTGEGLQVKYSGESLASAVSYSVRMSAGQVLTDAFSF